MKVILLAGGFGTRISEETAARPKPMVPIGDRPILCHIMDWYAAHGLNDFLIACGYKSEVIKSYFYNLHMQLNDWVFDFRAGTRSVLNRHIPDWRVAVIDTGLHTKTGGRIKRLQQYTGGETFMVTYGDGLSDVDLRQLLAFHRRHGKLATVTAVRPPARFGGLNLAGDLVTEFTEKPKTEGGWINGGFFVFEPGVFDYIAGDETSLEDQPLEQLARDRQLVAYRHEGFWQPMDTLRDKQLLEAIWQQGHAPWRTQRQLAPRKAA